MFLFVYSPSDFVSGLPDEFRGAAAGRPPFTLTLRPDAEPTLIEVADDDAVFNEIGDSQPLVSPVSIDGAAYPAGTLVHSSYDLINSGSGHKVTTLHFGGDGFQQGAVQGLVSTIPLQPGQSYTFDIERSSYQQNNNYQDYVACFTTGTRIRTPSGERPIEDLRPGDFVVTLDNGPQAIRWIGSQTVSAEGKLAPICFAPETVGNAGMLRVSPEHRMLVADPRASLYFAQDTVLVAAKDLVNGDTIRRETGGSVTYTHMMFDNHEVIFAEGAPSEAFLLCDHSLKGLTAAGRAELLAIFGGEGPPTVRAARACLRKFEAKLLAA